MRAMPIGNPGALLLRASSRNAATGPCIALLSFPAPTSSRVGGIRRTFQQAPTLAFTYSCVGPPYPTALRGRRLLVSRTQAYLSPLPKEERLCSPRGKESRSNLLCLHRGISGAKRSAPESYGRDLPRR